MKINLLRTDADTRPWGNWKSLVQEPNGSLLVTTVERSTSGISRGVPFKPPLTPTLLSASVVADVPVGVNAVLVILWQGDVSGYGGAA